MKYTAQIDGGRGGTETFTADTAAEALVQAITWAKDGDWPEEGCDVDVSVENEEDIEDTAEETIHIQSDDEKLDEKLDEEGEVLAEEEGEFTTDSVIRIDDEYFFRHANGGERGAYERRNHGGQVFSTESISRTEARAKMLEMGLEPSEVAAKTRD